jgi:hypothetical protein
MAVSAFSKIQKQQVQELVDLIAIDGLPDNKEERLATLQLLAKSDSWVPTHCPETGISLEGIDAAKHAQSLWPDVVPVSRMSEEALEREAALYRAAGIKVPHRRN